MMDTWGGLIVTNVIDTTGNFRQLYPAWLDAGSAAGGYQNRRRPCEGQLLRFEVVPATGVGGIFELWDCSGEMTGANDVNAGTGVTAAYVTAKATTKEARCIWRVDFDGALDGSNKMLGIKVPFTKGLLCRYIKSGVAGANSVTVNLVVDGGFMAYQGNI